MKRKLLVKVGFSAVLAAFALLCCGTLFAVSDAFVDTRNIPKEYAFGYGAALLALTVALVPKVTGKLLVRRLDYIFIIIVLFCSIQALYGVLQSIGILSAYGTGRVTGSFDNPAGFAACLCAGVPFAVGLFRHRFLSVRVYAIIVVMLLIIAVVVSASRAGIAALGAVALSVVWGRLTTRKRLILAVAGAAVLAALYLFRRDSADGRLLIWRCSLEMIRERPLWGHGPGGFTTHYMDYQAAYLQNHPDSRYVLLADNVHHPFNEYLLLAIDYGAVGVIVAAVLAFLIWRACRKRWRQDAAVRAAGRSLLAILVFGCVSYPFSYPFVWVVVLSSVGVIYRKSLKLNVSIRVILSATAVLSIVFITANVRYELLWRRISRQAEAGRAVEVSAGYEYLEKKMGENRYFLYNCAYELSEIKEYDRSLAVVLKCRAVWADYYLELMIADNYLKTKRYEESERHFRQAAAMCPVRFMPLYKLVGIYTATGRDAEAVTLARQILEKEVKIPSSVIDAVKYRMRQLIDSTERRTPRMELQK